MSYTPTTNRAAWRSSPELGSAHTKAETGESQWPHAAGAAQSGAAPTAKSLSSLHSSVARSDAGPIGAEVIVDAVTQAFTALAVAIVADVTVARAVVIAAVAVTALTGAIEGAVEGLEGTIAGIAATNGIP